MTEVRIRHADDAHSVFLADVPFGDVGDIIRSLTFETLQLRTGHGSHGVYEYTTGFVYDTVRDAAYYEIVIEDEE